MSDKNKQSLDMIKLSKLPYVWSPYIDYISQGSDCTTNQNVHNSFRTYLLNWFHLKYLLLLQMTKSKARYNVHQG